MAHSNVESAHCAKSCLYKTIPSSGHLSQSDQQIQSHWFEAKLPLFPHLSWLMYQRQNSVSPPSNAGHVWMLSYHAQQLSRYSRSQGLCRNKLLCYWGIGILRVTCLHCSMPTAHDRFQTRSEKIQGQNFVDWKEVLQMKWYRDCYHSHCWRINFFFQINMFKPL